jgi:hypothetical protein
MIIDYKKLPETSKIYIYPASRKLYPKEVPIVTEKVGMFLDNILPNDLFFEIKYDRFLIIIVSDRTPLSSDQNEDLASLILDLQKELNIGLMDKVNVCFKQGEFVQLKEIPDFKKLIKNKGVSKKTIVFDNLINTKSEYECCWEVPANISWISHFFN